MENEFYDSIIKDFEKETYDINGRYKSWEHCYSFFNLNRDIRDNDSVVDLLSLHLAFYLASWGMYRGSSFLLYKDYKVHHDAVLEILKDEYRPLWNVKCKGLLENHCILEQVLKIKETLRTIYTGKIENIVGVHKVTDTLITKIMMGTFGCVPAYDRFFFDGTKKFGIATGTFNEKSITDISRFYIKNEDKIEECRTEISKYGIEYPQMKIVDMYFWQIGYDLSLKTVISNKITSIM